ncbi:MAG: zinc ribbon domain-containing protein [Dehalococcoidia bacterium]
MACELCGRSAVFGAREPAGASPGEPAAPPLPPAAEVAQDVTSRERPGAPLPEDVPDVVDRVVRGVGDRLKDARVQAASGERRCPACGRAATPSARFCAGCGTALAAAASPGRPACSACGREVGEGAHYCAGCGGRLGSVKAPGLCPRRWAAGAACSRRRGRGFPPPAIGTEQTEDRASRPRVGQTGAVGGRGMYCAGCGRRFGADDRFCEQCGAKRPEPAAITAATPSPVSAAPAPPFREMRDRFERLRTERDVGLLTGEAFAAALQGLLVEHDGHYWTIGAGTGRWYVDRDGAWVEAEPPAGPAVAMATLLTAPERRLMGHGGAVTRIAVSPDGRWALSGSDDTTVRLWDIATGAEVRRFTGHTATVQGVAFSPNGQWALSGGLDGTARLWDPQDGREVRRFAAPHIQSVCFSPDGRWIMTAQLQKDASVRLWDPATGAALARFDPHPGVTLQAVFLPDGARILARGDHLITLWDVNGARSLARLPGRNRIERIAVSPDGKRALSSEFEGGLRLWDIHAAREIRSWQGDEILVNDVTFSPDGRTALTGGTARAVLWDLATGAEILSLEGHTNVVLGVAFVQEGSMALTASYDSTIGVWRLPRGSLPYYT